jgi:stage II sporulation protein D
MQNKVKMPVLAIVILLIIGVGGYSLLRSPAQKPGSDMPMPLPGGNFSLPKVVQPIPGVEPLDTTKYASEPTISVWMAEKGYAQTMHLEKYLEGVVAREMEPDWPMEALAAQAIASRTLTLNAMQAGTIKKLHHTDVSTAKEELQAYAPQLVNENVRQAVRLTRGQVLLYGGGLVNAIYSSCNGQIAATKEEAFPKEIPTPTPYFQPVVDTCFEYAPPKEQSWTVKIPASEVAAAVGYSGNPGDITILEKGPSGRILYIGAGNKKIYGADFRKIVGYDRLKSTLISEMNYDGENFIFKGMGWGSGVGLCQWGAYTFAQQGLKAEDILKQYYIGAQLKKIWE